MYSFLKTWPPLPQPRTYIICAVYNSFCMWTVFPIILVEGSILSILCILDTLMEDHLTIRSWINFWALFSILFDYKWGFMPVGLP